MMSDEHGPLFHEDGTFRSAAIQAYVNRIVEQREEILEAFVAKYGAQPDEIVQVVQHHPDGSTRWYVTLVKPGT